MRQIEFARLACAGLGGNGIRSGADVIGQKSQQQMCIEPGACQLRIFDGKLGHVENGLHALEGQFNLPAHGIEVLEAFGGSLFVRQGGEQDQTISRVLGARVLPFGLAPDSLTFYLQASLGRCLPRLGQHDQTHGSRRMGPDAWVKAGTCLLSGR